MTRDATASPQPCPSRVGDPTAASAGAEAARQAALDRTGLLDTPPEANFDRFTRLVTTIIRVPIALICLVAADRQFFKSSVGLADPLASDRQTPLSHSFCRYAVAAGAPLLISDARTDPLMHDNPATTEFGFVAYAGVPLVSGDGHPLGTLCAIDQAPREWTPGDVAILTDLAAAVGTEIDLRAAVATARTAEAALRKQQHVTRHLIDTVPMALYVFDLHERRTLFVSPRGPAFLGLSNDEVQDAGLDFLLRWMHPDDQPRANAHFRQIATVVDGQVLEFEYRLRNARGEWRWFLSRDVVHARDTAGQPTQVLGVALDVTMHQRAEEERMAFVDTLAHDVKNPLGVVKGRAQLVRRQLQRGTVDVEKMQADLTGIEVAVDQAIALIDEMFDSAHLRAGQTLGLRLEAVDLVALAKSCAQDARHATTHHWVRVETEVPRLIGAWDRARLERVGANLLSNAVKYSPAESEIVVRVRREGDATSGWAVLEVSDRGVGIPAGDLPHLFERFRRGANVAGRIAGRGIGLAGAKQIVAQHGGTIAVESREGHGSTFRVRLPLTPPARSPSAPG